MGEFYAELDSFAQPISPRFDKVRQGLLAERWLARYGEEKVCFDAFVVMERRMRRPVLFAEHASEHIVANKARIVQGFRDFYPQLLRFAEQITPQLRQHITTQDQSHGGL